MAEGLRETVKQLTPLFSGASRARLDPGQTARMRRLDPDAPSEPAFWAIVAEVLEPALPPDGEAEARRDAERRWAVALRAMATLADLSHPNRRLGAALAEAGYAEMRLQRMLSCPADRLPIEVQTAARFLAAKGVAVDYTDLVRLAVLDRPQAAEGIRRGIARDYFRTQYKTQAARGAAAEEA